MTLAQLLKDLKRSGKNLEDVPAATLRDAQKRGFPDMRSITLAPPRIVESLQRPLLRDLLVTRIGYCSRAAGHNIPRPEGSLDHIMHYCLAGRGWLRMAGRTWEVPADTALFIPRGVPHSYGADPDDPWSIYWIHFTGRQAGEFFDALQLDIDHPLLALPQNDDILSALHLIERHLCEVHTHQNLIAASTALARFLGMIQLRNHSVTESGSTLEERIQQTIDFMRVNLAMQIPLRELAQLAHMSVSSYVGAFSRRTGFTPIHYYNRMKVQHACRLLSETHLPVHAICAEVGIVDPYYFSRLFRKLVGIPPREFRRQHSPSLAGSH